MNDPLPAILKKSVRNAYQQLLRLGVPFPDEPDLWADADLLWIRLEHPISPLQVHEDGSLVISCTDSDTEISTATGRTERVPPGAKAVYTFSTANGGEGRLKRLDQDKRLSIAIGAKIIVTAMDFETRIMIVPLEGTPCRINLAVGDSAQLAGPARLEVWECTCGHHRCAERHRLAAWNPAEQPLENFLASAVKGPGQTIVTGSFMQGMLYALWAREGF